MNTPHPDRMHRAGSKTEKMLNLAFEYSKKRLLDPEIPLDKPSSASELKRLAGPTITEHGIGAHQALNIFEHVLAPACISVDHPNYLSFIPTAPTKAAEIFDMIVGASSVYGGSWLEGSGAVYAENEVLGWLAREIGFPETAGGVFLQGGTLGNLSALVAARETARKQRTLPDGKRWVVLCSQESHASITAAAHIMDIKVCAISPGDNGSLCADDVKDAFETYGDAVFAVVATAGTTNFGIVDDIASFATLKQTHSFWLHIDGAYGLAAILCKKTQTLFAGIEHADSIIVDPHKWLFAPFDACALIYRCPEQGRLAHTQRAEYLASLTETHLWNPSDYGVQLTRRARGLPLWFSLATHGVAAYREAITYCIDLAHEVAVHIEKTPWLRLVRPPELSVVVFEREGWTKEDYERWSSTLLETQVAFVNPSSHQGRPNTRFAFINPRTKLESALKLLESMKS